MPVDSATISSPRLVYIPGMALSGKEMEDAAALVKAAGFEYVCVSRPGLATDTHPDWDTPLDPCAEQERVRAQLSDGCVVMAHSFGGYLVPVDSRIAAIIYLDASIPGHESIVPSSIIWKLTRPFANIAWLFSNQAMMAIYENASFKSASMLAEAQKHSCRKIVLTAGATGKWFKLQREFAQQINAEHRWLDGPHVISAVRPIAIAAQAVEILRQARGL